jgi:hypothetical protein
MIGLLNRTALVALALAASVPVLPGAASAQEFPARSPGVHEHDGFFLRFILGPSVLQATTSEQNEDVTLSGTGATFHIAMGFNIMPRLIIYGEIFDDVTVSPKLEVGDSGEMDLEDTTLGVIGVGGGLAYYFRNNFFISAALSAAQLRADVEQPGEDETSETDYGFGVNTLFGREWFVSDNWALGFAGQIFFASVPDDDQDESWKVIAVGLGLSATYD